MLGGRGEGVRRWWRKGARTIVECVGAEAGWGRGGKAGYGQRGKEDGWRQGTLARGGGLGGGMREDDFALYIEEKKWQGVESNQTRVLKQKLFLHMYLIIGIRALHFHMCVCA